MNQNIATFCEGTSSSLDVALYPHTPSGKDQGKLRNWGIDLIGDRNHFG